MFFDDMIANMISNNLILTELFVRGRKLKSLAKSVLITSGLTTAAAAADAAIQKKKWT